MENHPVFTAHVTRGSGKGRAMGFPTINLSLSDVPSELLEGVYAVRVTMRKRTLAAAMIFGERLFHKLPKSCEVHLIDVSVDQVPETLTIEVLRRLRDVRNFETEEELKKQIARDVEEVKRVC